MYIERHGRNLPYTFRKSSSLLTFCLPKPAHPLCSMDKMSFSFCLCRLYSEVSAKECRHESWSYCQSVVMLLGFVPEMFHRYIAPSTQHSRASIYTIQQNQFARHIHGRQEQDCDGEGKEEEDFFVANVHRTCSVWASRVLRRFYLKTIVNHCLPVYVA